MPSSKPRHGVLRVLFKALHRCGGYKCCLVWVLLSVWAVVQLTVMALLFQFHSVALLSESVEHGQVEMKTSEKTFNGFARTGTRNCAVATLLYLFCGVAAYCRIRVLKRRAAKTPEEFHIKRSLPIYMDAGDNKVSPLRPIPIFY